MSVGKQESCCCRCQAYYIIRVGLGSARFTLPIPLSPLSLSLSLSLCLCLCFVLLPSFWQFFNSIKARTRTCRCIRRSISLGAAINILERNGLSPVPCCPPSPSSSLPLSLSNYIVCIVPRSCALQLKCLSRQRGSTASTSINLIELHDMRT